MKHASALISPPVCGLQRWAVGVSHQCTTQSFYFHTWWPVLYLVKILLFAWFPRETVCESCCFLSICLTRLDFLAYIYIFPDYLLIWQGDRKPKMRESSLKFDYKKFMKMNGQLGNYSCVWGWVGSFCLCLGVSSCLYVEPTIIRKLV